MRYLVIIFGLLISVNVFASSPFDKGHGDNGHYGDTTYGECIQAECGSADGTRTETTECIKDNGHGKSFNDNHGDTCKEDKVVTDAECTVEEVEECTVEEPQVVEPPVVVAKSKKHHEKCDHEPGDVFGFGIGSGVITWNTRKDAPKIDITAYAQDQTTVLYKLRTDDDGEFALNGLPGNFFKARFKNNCGLGDWTTKVAQ